MARKYGYYVQLDETAESMLRVGDFLGCGHNGIVYLLEGNKVIKIFKDMNICKNEYELLKKTEKSKYFPKVYSQGPYYIIKDYVPGQRLDYYIRKKGINKRICYEIIKLIKEFEKLEFTKLDIRCKDLYIDNDFSIKVIDPRNNYLRGGDYPRHLMKGLYKLGVLDEFLEVVKEQYNQVYKEWSFKIKRYLYRGIK